MPRGGKRQGTPGRGYSNRTDLAMDPNMAQNTAATGGEGGGMPNLAPSPRSPEDTPMLLDPTGRPQEPITAGMASGAGPGPEALTGMDPRQAEAQTMKKWMPYLKPIIDEPDTPESVKLLYKFLRRS